MDYNFGADLLSTFRSVHDGVKGLIVIGFFTWATVTTALLITRLLPDRSRPATPRPLPPVRAALPPPRAEVVVRERVVER